MSSFNKSLYSKIEGLKLIIQFVHDIAEILLELTLNTNQSTKIEAG